MSGESPLTEVAPQGTSGDDVTTATTDQNGTAASQETPANETAVGEDSSDAGQPAESTVTTDQQDDETDDESESEAQDVPLESADEDASGEPPESDIDEPEELNDASDPGADAGVDEDDQETNDSEAAVSPASDQASRSDDAWIVAGWRGKTAHLLGQMVNWLDKVA